MLPAERRRAAHKSSPLALRSPDDSSRPAADVNQTSCPEMKGPVKRAAATSTPLSAYLCDAPALIANRC